MTLERWRPFGASIERWEPFRNISEIQHEMNMWIPVLDMDETKDDLILNFELPGVREQDVSLSITGDLLTVEGERAVTQELKGESYHHVERVHGRFERTVRLPMPVQAEQVKATYHDGVLEVELQKSEEIEPKEIKIDIL